MKNLITNNNIQSPKALAALMHVMDPEIGLNVVDLGLIYQLDFDESENQLFASMTLTTQFCPMGESIRDGVMQALQQAFPAYTIQVNVVFNPPWSHERISKEGQEFLNQ